MSLGAIDVGAGLGVDERGAREDSSVASLSMSVTPAAFVLRRPVPVIGVLADADVGDHHQLGRGVLHRADGARHGPLGS